jgi:uncharacterized protein YndB with AHSA1/START domain
MSERVVETILELTADPLRVWNAITDPEQLSRWFPDEVEFDPRPGAPGAFTWKDHGRFAVEVEVVEAPYLLVWRWMHEPGSEFRAPDATRVEWILTPHRDGGTTIHLRESGFKTDRHHHENTEGWAHELAELKALLGE